LTSAVTKLGKTNGRRRLKWKLLYLNTMKRYEIKSFPKFMITNF